MRSVYIFITCLVVLSACNSKSGKEQVEVKTDTLLDSTELKAKADTTKKQIMHIGDSIEQMQRRAEAEAND